MAISSNLPAPLQAISPVAGYRAGARNYAQHPSTKATLLTGTASPGYANQTRNFADMAAALGAAQGFQASGRYAGSQGVLSSLVAAAYSTAPIIRPGQFVNIYL